MKLFLASKKTWALRYGIFALTLVFTAIQFSQPVSASYSGWDAGNIISDNVFSNNESMSVSEIQAFLNAKVPACDTNGTQLSEFGGPDLNGDGKVQRWEWGKSNYNQTTFTCLKSYKQNNKSAAQIIKEIANQYKINPQVILVLLQKEQALITDTWPVNIQYRSATGYGCPDTAACDSQYYGFTNQVKWAAMMFRAIMNDSPDWYTPYELGVNYIQYNPTAACGGSNVDIKNRATQALYNYTPYQPNNATLKWKFAGGSSPGGCGAYGNLNFYVYFTQWFKSTQGVDIYAIGYDQVADKDGEITRVGFGLSQKPTADVKLTFGVSSRSNAEIVGKSTITITKETWNQPEKNIIITRGLDNPSLTGNYTYNLVMPSKPESKDIRYSSLASTAISVPLLLQDSLENKTVYRMKLPGAVSVHSFTSSTIERDALIAQGWQVEATPFSFCSVGNQPISRLSKNNDYRLVISNSSEAKDLIKEGFKDDGLVFTASSQGGVPVYWRYDATNQRSLYTTSISEGLSNGFIDKGIVFHVCSSDTQAVYRLYKQNGSHFYTSSARERDKAIYTLGYRYEKLGFYACKDGPTPVHRFIKVSNGIRFYTTSEAEKQKGIQLGYTYEGIAFTLCADGNTDILRLYSPSTGFRLYTTSSGEAEVAEDIHGYTYEGVGFVAY